MPHDPSSGNPNPDDDVPGPLVLKSNLVPVLPTVASGTGGSDKPGHSISRTTQVPSSGSERSSVLTTPGPDAVAVAAAWKYATPGTAAEIEARIAGTNPEGRSPAFTLCVRIRTCIKSPVAEADDAAPLGTAVGWIIRRPDGSLGQLHVEPPHRRRGIARALVREATVRVMMLERSRAGAFAAILDAARGASHGGAAAADASKQCKDDDPDTVHCSGMHLSDTTSADVRAAID